MWEGRSLGMYSYISRNTSKWGCLFSLSILQGVQPYAVGEAEWRPRFFLYASHIRRVKLHHWAIECNFNFYYMKSAYSKRLTGILVISILYVFPVFSQEVCYQVLNAEMSSSTDVRLKLLVYSKSKKTIDAEAQCAAIKVVLFDGCPNTPYAKALVEDGEVTSSQKYPQYFERLYNERFVDFLSSYKATSAFEKGDKNKGTAYTVEVKALKLRKDLEKNEITKRLGL